MGQFTLEVRYSVWENGKAHEQTPKMFSFSSFDGFLSVLMDDLYSDKDPIHEVLSMTCRSSGFEIWQYRHGNADTEGTYEYEILRAVFFADYVERILEELFRYFKRRLDVQECQLEIPFREETAKNAAKKSDFLSWALGL